MAGPKLLWRQVFDVETGAHKEVLNLNPDGWIQGVSSEKNWLMLYGLDVCKGRGLIAGGDSQGFTHFVDPRAPGKVSSHQLHRKGNKVCPTPFSSPPAPPSPIHLFILLSHGGLAVVVSWGIYLLNIKHYAQ